MPIWVKIAQIGDRNTKQFFLDLGATPDDNDDFCGNSSNDEPNHNNNNNNTDDQQQQQSSSSSQQQPPADTTTTTTTTDILLIPSNRADFICSIFFIQFGIVAAVAGVGTNIYVQVNEIFFTPH